MADPGVMRVRAAALPLTLSEADFQATVVNAALLFGWLVSHQRPARTGRGWVTAIAGHAGLPDLVLAKAGRVLLVELKSQHGRLTPGQRAWQAALGDHGRVFRPSDWPELLTELAA